MLLGDVLGAVAATASGISELATLIDMLETFNDIKEMSIDLGMEAYEEFVGEWGETIDQIKELKEQGEEVQEKVDEVMEHLDGFRARVYPRVRGEWFNIVQRSSGMCLKAQDITLGISSNPNLLLSRDMRSRMSQFRMVHTRRPGVVVFQCRGNGKYLNVVGNSRSKGALVITYSDRRQRYPSYNSQWKMKKVDIERRRGDDWHWYNITSKHSRRGLYCQSPAPACQWEDLESPKSQWRFEVVE